MKMTNTLIPVPATTRPIKLHEVVLIVLSRRPAAGDEGITAEELTLILMHEPLAANVSCNLNSIYASMSGMQTKPRQWLHPAETYVSKGTGATMVKRGRNAKYRITPDGRARARWLLAELESKDLK
jgi:hypothetical protein